MQQISQTQTNSGTALLIQKGFESSAKNPNPSLYLDEYNFIQTANASDFLQTIEFVEKSLLLSVYSKDSNWDNSATVSAKISHAAWIGSELSISTPATFSASIGYREPPDFKNAK